jgi:hypothetical protein
MDNEEWWRDLERQGWNIWRPGINDEESFAKYRQFRAELKFYKMMGYEP